MGQDADQRPRGGIRQGGGRGGDGHGISPTNQTHRATEDPTGDECGARNPRGAQQAVAPGPLQPSALPTGRLITPWRWVWHGVAGHLAMEGRSGRQTKHPRC